MKDFIAQTDAFTIEKQAEGFSKLYVSGSNGCTLGLTICVDTDFGQPAVHEDQEGFVFVSGTGVALLDDQAYPVCPGMLMILQPGTRHAFKKDAACAALQYYWFHAAAK